MDALDIFLWLGIAPIVVVLIAFDALPLRRHWVIGAFLILSGWLLKVIAMLAYMVFLLLELFIIYCLTLLFHGNELDLVELKVSRLLMQTGDVLIDAGVRRWTTSPSRSNRR